MRLSDVVEEKPLFGFDLAGASWLALSGLGQRSFSMISSTRSRFERSSEFAVVVRALKVLSSQLDRSNNTSLDQSLRRRRLSSCLLAIGALLASHRVANEQRAQNCGNADRIERSKNNGRDASQK